MASRWRREAWLGLVIFPAVLLVAKTADLLVEPEKLEAAAVYQRQFMSDLIQFNPVTFIVRIWDVIAATARDSVANLPAPSDVGFFLLGIGLLIVRLPIILGGTVLTVVGSVWQNDTTLASIIVTISFLISGGAGIAIANELADNNGLWAWIPATLLIYLLGTLICSALWATAWLGLTLFGWFTDLAGFCFLCGAPVSVAYFAAIQYAGFRSAHQMEKALSPAGEEFDAAKPPPS